MSKITLITPTGGRPDAFKLCERWMSRQKVGIDQWLVVDDTFPHYPDSKTELTMEQQKILAPLPWKKGINTQRYNLGAMLPYITGDFVFVIEDDDYYSPDYLNIMSKMLGYLDVVGECDAKYFHVGLPAWKEMKNFGHACLCQTAFRRDSLELFEKAVHSGEYYIDIKLWDLVKESRIKMCLFGGAPYSVGIKGMPGKFGLGVGHRPQGFTMDVEFRQLRSWIGDDYKVYKDMKLKLV